MIDSTIITSEVSLCLRGVALREVESCDGFVVHSDGIMFDGALRGVLNDVAQSDFSVMALCIIQLWDVLKAVDEQESMRSSRARSMKLDVPSYAVGIGSFA